MTQQIEKAELCNRRLQTQNRENMQNDVQQHFQNIQQIIRQGKAGAWQAVNAHTLLVN